MSRRLVTSSNLRSVDYDPETLVLEIEFHHGGRYTYHQVPASEYDGLIGAKSKGRYHHEHIKWAYAHERVDA